MAWIRSRVVPRILLVLILTPLLGLGAQSHTASRELRRAQHALEAGMSLSAAQHLAQAAEILPSRPELWEQAGSLALAGGDPQTAVNAFERAASRSLSPAGQLQLGDAYLQTGDLDSALRLWESLAFLPETASAALERLVSAYLDKGDFQNAAASLQALNSVQPDNAQNHYQLGLLVATQDPAAALIYLTRAAELDPSYAARVRSLQRDIRAAQLESDPAFSLLAAGRSLARLGEWLYAAEAFRQVTLLRPDYAEGWAYYGEARQHLPSPDQSSAIGLIELEKALAIEPASLAANSFTALYWQRQGRYDRALEAIKTAVALEPGNPVLLVELGNTLAMQGDLDSAYQAFLQAIQLAPRDGRYPIYLVEFSLKYDYHVAEIGLPAARQAVLLAPADPAGLDTMAQVLLKLADQVNAERFLHRALQIDPQFAPAHLHLGMLYLLKNQPQQASEALSQAAVLAPQSAAGQQAQQLLLQAVP